MRGSRGPVYRLMSRRQVKYGEEGLIYFSRIFGVLLVVLTWMLLTYAPFFRIRHIEIINHGTIGGEEIIVASGIARGQSIFWINRRAVLKGILKNLKIRAVEMVLKYPDRVQLIIEERLPIAVIPYNDQMVWIGEDGIMMAITQRKAQPRVPVITGCKLTVPKLGETVKDPNFENVLNIMGRLDDSLRQIAIKIDLRRLCLYIPGFETGEIPVEFGDGRQIEQKIANLRAILQQVNFKRIQGIDLRVPNVPTVVSKN